MQKTYSEQMTGNYRTVEAMYHKDYDTDEIARELCLDRMLVVDIMQKIFHNEMKRRQVIW